MEKGHMERDLEVNVRVFNIFDNKIWYAKLADSVCEIWFMDLNGSNKTIFYTTKADEEVWCRNPVVGEHNIVCDIGPADDFYPVSRYVIDRDLEYVNVVEFK